LCKRRQLLMNLHVNEHAMLISILALSLMSMPCSFKMGTGSTFLREDALSEPIVGGMAKEGKPFNNPCQTNPIHSFGVWGLPNQSHSLLWGLGLAKPIPFTPLGFGACQTNPIHPFGVWGLPNQSHSPLWGLGLAKPIPFTPLSGLSQYKGIGLQQVFCQANHDVGQYYGPHQRLRNGEPVYK